MRHNRDILWKGIIEEVFDDLLRFIWPEADRIFDMTRKFGFLDKELRALYPEPAKTSGVRYVDKLVQVYRLGGEAEWLFVHLEVQDANEKEFPERMFRYYYRIFDKEHRPVTAVAIFTGADGHKIPDEYSQLCLGSEVRYKYNVLRIGNYTEAELSANRNPFALVALVARKYLLMQKMPDEQRMEHKLSIARALIARKDIPREKTAAIMVFLNTYLVFRKRESNRIFIEHFEQYKDKKNPMGILEMYKQDLRVELSKELRKELRNEARKEARKEVQAEEREKAVRAWLAHTEFSTEKIASLVGVSVAFVRKIRKEVRGK